MERSPRPERHVRAAADHEAHGPGPQRDPNVLLDLLGRPRYELLPFERTAEEAAVHLPPGATVTVTSSPRRGLEATLDVAERIAGLGFHVVPHIAARLVRDREHAEEILRRLEGCSVRELFVIGGDSDEPAGTLEDALSLLTAIEELGHDLDAIGIAGYPEGHPAIADDVLTRALLDKADLATYVVTQVCFEPGSIAGWIAGLRSRGFTLPVYVGVPGVVHRTRLLRISLRIGVGESVRFLRSTGGWAGRLLVSRAFDPERLVDALAPSVTDPAAGVVGFHFYTFNEVEGTEAWRQAKLRTLREASAPTETGARARLGGRA